MEEKIKEYKLRIEILEKEMLQHSANWNKAAGHRDELKKVVDELENLINPVTEAPIATAKEFIKKEIPQE